MVEKPGHAISLDFIPALPTTLSPDFFDCVISVTDKFTKRITLIPGRSTYSAEDWADALLERLDIAN